MTAFARNPFRALDLSHSGIVRVVIAALSVAMVVYHMGAIIWGTSEALIFRGTHLLFALALTFLIYRRSGSSGEDGRPAPLDYVLLGVALVPVLYLFVNYDYVVNRIYYVDDLTWPDMIMGTLLVVMIIEATRRLIGWALPLTAIAFVIL